MESNNIVEVRESSAFIFELAPIRRSAFIEAIVSLEQIETGLVEMSLGRLQVYLGHRVEYSVVSSRQRLIATVGALGKGVVGIAVEYWGECEQEFNELLSLIQRFASK